MDGKRTKVNLREKAAIFALLAEYCKRDGEYANYDEGWDDDRIAAEVAKNYPHVNTGHVQYIRLHVYGKTRDPRGGPSNSAVEKQIDEIADMLKNVETILLNHSQVLSKLAEWASRRPKDPFRKVTP